MDFFRPAWSSASGSSGATPWPTMADNPALGPTREHQLRAQRMADAAVRISEAQRRLQTLCSDALRDASLSFIETLESFGPLINGANTQSTERLGLDALLRLYNSWIECAEEAYARTAHSESFCTAMADFVNSNSQWRVEFRSAWEHWSHMLDLPTRSELNSLARLLKSTEEQLRAKRPIRTQRNEPAGPAKRPRKS